ATTTAGLPTHASLKNATPNAVLMDSLPNAGPLVLTHVLLKAARRIAHVPTHASPRNATPNAVLMKPARLTVVPSNSEPLTDVPSSADPQMPVSPTNDALSVTH